MSLLLLLADPLPPDCQEPFAAPETARWIEAEGASDGEWLGWGPSGPRRAGAPVRGPWLALEFELPPLPADDESWVLGLAGGSRLRGEPGPDLPDAGLATWRLALPGAPLLPLDSLWLRAQGRGALPPADSGAREDRLWLRRPGGVLDLRQGFLLDWRAAGAVFQTAGGERTVPWSDVHAMALLDEPVAEPAGTVWLFLADGSTLAAKVLGQDPHAEGGAWSIELPWGARARLPAASITRVRRREGVEEWARASWEVREHPRAEVLDWSPKFGAAVEGGALRLGGRTWPDGIGVKAPSEVARAAPGPGTLLLTVGADDRTAGVGQPQPIVFRVLLGGEELTRTPPLSAATGPRTLLVPVPRAGTLRLRAELAGPYAQGAHGDWCDLVWLPGS
jgi:hypothetical protein